MHIFYVYESGSTGKNLNDPNQPIFVIGAVGISDEKWRKTLTCMEKLVRNFFGKDVHDPAFELHATNMLIPSGKGVFKHYDFQDRVNFVRKLIDLLCERKHSFHIIAIDKRKLRSISDYDKTKLHYDFKNPYLLALDFLVRDVDSYLSKRMGRSATGIVVIDERDDLKDEIRDLVRYRVLKCPKKDRLNRIIEFTYAVDSRRNPMIQVADILSYCALKYFEIVTCTSNLHKEAKAYFVNLFEKIHERRPRKTPVNFDKSGRSRGEAQILNRVVSECFVEFRRYKDA